MGMMGKSMGKERHDAWIVVVKAVGLLGDREGEGDVVHQQKTLDARLNDKEIARKLPHLVKGVESHLKVMRVLLQSSVSKGGLKKILV